MQRTTVMADEELLDELRQIAAEEDLSLAEVIRQGMRLRARRSRRPTFIGAVSTGTPTAIADEAEDLRPEPRAWR